jgi:hypothetical protein
MVCCCIGCKNIPTEENITKIGQMSGYTTAIILNSNTNINTQTIKHITDIINLTRTIIPNSNSTFTVTWMPLAKQHITSLVEKSKLSQNEGNLVVEYFGKIVSLIDVYIETKNIKQHQNLISLFISNFSDMFIRNINTTNKLLSIRETELDKFTIDFFKQ